MSRSLVERRLTEVSARLRQLRDELAVADEQLAHLAETADDARLRALVSETPLADQEHHEAQRHADAMQRHRAEVLEDIAKLETDPGRAARPPPGRDRSPEPPTERSPTVTTRVVIAEDEAIIRLDLKETLEEEGYEVVGETGRGDEAVQLVRELEPDLAILDIKMPGLDGLAAAREITAERRAAVLILTAFSPARPDRAGPRRRRPRLPGEAVPAVRADPGRRGGPRAASARCRPCSTRPRASRSSSRPARSSTGPRACSWTTTA